jgi:hypothetical protein
MEPRKVGLHYPIYFQLLEVLLQKLVDLKFTRSLLQEHLQYYLELKQYNILWSLVVVAEVELVQVLLEVQVVVQVDIVAQSQENLQVAVLQLKLN